MNVLKPVIVIGTGRSGTTIFHQILSTHPNLAWMSERTCEKHPAHPKLNAYLMKAIDIPIAGRLFKRNDQAECYTFWDHFAPGFSMPCRDLTARDLGAKQQKSLINAMSKMTTPQRDRLLVKITGWSRLGFLHALFPDAKFIHVKRDGRAVSSSLLNVPWWLGWRGPENWRWGPLSQRYSSEWNRFDQSFSALAGIQWKILMDAIDKSKVEIPENQYMEIKYEELCENPQDIFRSVAKFCELEWSSKFEKNIAQYRLVNTNHKWGNDLSLRQRDDLEGVLNHELEKYGYVA